MFCFAAAHCYECVLAVMDNNPCGSMQIINVEDIINIASVTPNPISFSQILRLQQNLNKDYQLM
jgi:predicted transglutaminase-like protease